MRGSFGFLNSAPSCLISLQPLLCHLLLPQPHGGGHLSGVLSPSFPHFPQSSFISSCGFGSPSLSVIPHQASCLDFSFKSVLHFYLADRFLFLDVFPSSQTHFTKFLQELLLLISPCLLMAPLFPQSLRQTLESSQVNHFSCLPCPVSWPSDVHSVFTSSFPWFCHPIPGSCDSALDFWNSFLIGFRASSYFSECILVTDDSS